jgi:hypothetical protein
MSTNTNFITLKVWLPGSAPGVHPHNLVLENPNALLFFLEAIARGNVVYPYGKQFSIVAYQGNMQIGLGAYKVVAGASLSLWVIAETGEIEGVIREAWDNMLKHTKILESESEENV